MLGDNNSNNETLQMLERRGYIQGRFIVEGPTGRKLENYLAELKVIEGELGRRGIDISSFGGYGIFLD
ncbi:MAG: hypothetical protein NTU57_05285 [Candidatus Aenigmarchaeota archaeon]|nr:hypothetical protein [Candidatus Aenigmarchaeota archaeon]